MCFAQFAKMYRGCNPREKNSDDDEDDDEQEEEVKKEIIDDIEYDDEDDGNVKFDYIMTYEDKGKRGQALPGMIRLSNPYPGEASWMKKRSQPAALRFHKYKKDNDQKDT